MLAHSLFLVVLDIYLFWIHVVILLQYGCAFYRKI